MGGNDDKEIPGGEEVKNQLREEVDLLAKRIRVGLVVEQCANLLNRFWIDSSLSEVV